MSFKDVLRIRSFRDLWLGQAISQIGDSIYYVGFMFMTQQLTGSFAMVGYVGAMETLPYLLFGLYAGVIADRMDRTKVMLFSDLASTGCLLAFAALVFVWHGRPPVWSFLVIPFLLSTVRCFFMPAKSAAIPSLVLTELLTKANALSSSTMSIVGLGGIALAAGVIARLYQLSQEEFFATLLMLNGLSFAGSAYFITKLPALEPDREHLPEQHPLEDFKAGFRYMRARRDLKVLLILQSIFRLGLAPFFVIYVAANKTWFGGKPQTLMWFEFTFWIGLLLGSFVAGHWKVKRPTMVFSTELALIGVFIGLMAIPQIAIFVALNFICGVVVAAGDIPLTTYLQVSVEDGFRGRVNSARDMVTAGIMPIGMVFGGLLLSRLGVAGAFILTGVFMTIAGAAGFFDREYRNVRMPASARAPSVQDASLTAHQGEMVSTVEPYEIAN